jgi:VWFA-related protein
MERPIMQLAPVLILTLVAAASAQDVKFSSDVNVVSLLATVRDSDGGIIQKLTKEDFRLEEDGHPQAIRYFSQESNLPLTVCLLVDTSRSMQTVFEPERIASNRFLEQVLRPDRDVAAVVHFDVRVGVLQGFTASREKLAAALAELRIPRLPSTLLYDAIKRTSENQMRQQLGRKAFILLSDGMDVFSRTSLGTAIEYAQRADTMIYAILFAHRLNRRRAGLGPAQIRGRRVMERLARETGGGFFEVSPVDTIDKIYAQIEDELRNQYSIGYTPTRPDKTGKYRKIKLTIVQKGLVARTRDGYYPK